MRRGVPLSHYAALALDFDGVVVESVELKDRAVAELFRAELPDRVEDIVRFQATIAGRSRYERFPLIYEYLGLPFPEGESERLDRRLSEILFEAVAACPFVNGAYEFIEQRSREHRPDDSRHREPHSFAGGRDDPRLTIRGTPHAGRRW